MTIINNLLLASLMTLSLSAKAADPISAITALDNILHTTSIVDIISKAVSKGADPSIIKTVPRLKVVADCGDCKLSNATKMLIKSSYIELAKTNDVIINNDKEVVFKVTSIFGRNSFLRGTFGVLSGADIIRGKFEGDTKVIGEYSVSHEMGIDEITQSLGEDCLKTTITNNSKQLETKP